MGSWNWWVGSGLSVIAESRLQTRAESWSVGLLVELALGVKVSNQQVEYWGRVL